MAFTLISQSYYQADAKSDLPASGTEGWHALVLDSSQRFTYRGGKWRSLETWEFLGSQVLAAPAQSMGVVFSARKYLMVMTYVSGKSALSTTKITFNSDTNNNYSFRTADDVSSTSGINQSGIDGSRNASDGEESNTSWLHNITGKAKRWYHHGPIDSSTPGQAPKLESSRGVYGITAGQITQITIDSGTAGVNLLAGSEISVWGRNED